MKLSEVLKYADVPEKETIRALFTENFKLDGKIFKRNLDINCYISSSEKPSVIKLESFTRYIENRKPELVNLIKYYGLKYLFSVKNFEKNAATDYLKKFVLIEIRSKIKNDMDVKKYYIIRLKPSNRKICL